jgi:hypothetical protein
MTIRCRQVADGEEQEYVIEPHADDQTDAELLAAKAAGANAKGWAVEWTGERSFAATKVRWGGILCTREFWTE